MYLVFKLAANLIYVQYVHTTTEIPRVICKTSDLMHVAPENIFCVQKSMWQTLAEGHIQERFTEKPKDYMLVLNAEEFFNELNQL